MAVFLGLAIVGTVLALNLVGEGLNDGLNARAEGRTR
jgi:peptide/nickel transport system permease protein